MKNTLIVISLALLIAACQKQQNTPVASYNPKDGKELLAFGDTFIYGRVNLVANVDDGQNIKWDFGDGVQQETNTQSVYHRYTKPGSYTVSAKIKDEVIAQTVNITSGISRFAEFSYPWIIYTESYKKKLRESVQDTTYSYKILLRAIDDNTIIVSTDENYLPEELELKFFEQSESKFVYRYDKGNEEYFELVIDYDVPIGWAQAIVNMRFKYADIQTDSVKLISGQSGLYID